MNIEETLTSLRKELDPFNCKLIAVSKTKPAQAIMQAFDSGQRDFGENKVQELVTKHETLPKEINWHMIGHLQTNKVKLIAPFVHLIHAVDSRKLLATINKEAIKNDRVIDCLLQMHIAREDSKFGLTKDELIALLDEVAAGEFGHVKIKGLMGMATNTYNEEQVSEEFRGLHELQLSLQSKYHSNNIDMTELSIGMSGDYKLALQEGSTMVRIGSTIFGQRSYP